MPTIHQSLLVLQATDAELGACCERMRALQANSPPIPKATPQTAMVARR